MVARTKNPSFGLNTRYPESSSSSEEANPSVASSEEANPSVASSSSDTHDEEIIPLQPLKMYFSHTEYGKQCKVATRCDISKAVEVLEKKLGRSEMSWFTEHPQFKHIFHMASQRNRKVMGMWMLLLHTACTDKTRQCWFVVNGVPIRYSIREHGLISGLHCHDYPDGYEKVGSMRFVIKDVLRRKLM